MGRIFLLQGGNAARFCLTQGANAVRFVAWLFCRFLPLFQSSTFLSLRFVRVVASEFFFRLRVVYCDDSARFFMGNSIGFASRKFFWKFCLSYPCFFEVPPRKFSGANFGIHFRERTFGFVLASTVSATIVCQYGVGHICLPVQYRCLCFLGVGLGSFSVWSLLCLLLVLPPSSFWGPARASFSVLRPSQTQVSRTTAPTPRRASIALIPLSFSPSLSPGSAPPPALAPCASLSLSLSLFLSLASVKIVRPGVWLGRHFCQMATQVS